MSRPDLTTHGGIYMLRWSDELIDIRVDRLSENSKYEVTGEILVTTRAPGSAPHLHQARFNLTSTSARGTLARHLESRYPDQDWTQVIEQMAVLVLRKHREGEPVIHMADYAPPERLAYRIHPILQERQSTVLFGHGDTGKSWFADYLTVLVTAGFSHNGFAPEPGRVLFVDYETDSDTFWDRINRICAGLDIPIPEHIYYHHAHLTLAACVEEIQRHVVEKQINLMFVDSAAFAVSEPEASMPTMEYFRALRSLNLTTMTIAHLPKTGNQIAPFGSVFWRNAPRANFRLASSQEPGLDEFVVALKHTKSNNGRRLRDMGFRLSFDNINNTVVFTQATLSDDPELAKELTLTQRLEETLRRGSKTVKELSDELETSESTIRTKLNQHKSMFQPINHEGAHFWGLKSLVQDP